MKGKFLYIWLFLPIMLMLLPYPSVAQIRVQVVTENISKTFEWATGMSMMLNGENAEINCTSHQSNTIEIDLTIISKHEDKSKAELDLQKMKWLAEVKNNVLFVRNYVELARNESKPESALKVIYNIKVPGNCPLDIKNYFGKIHIQNLDSTLSIKSEFCPVELTNISGTTTVNAVFGKVNASRFSGDFNIISNRSDLDISEFSGKLNIGATLANVSLFEMRPGATISIEAEKSYIDLIINVANQYTYQFDLINSEFKKPAGMFPDFKLKDQDAITASYHTIGKYPVIAVTLNVGSLTIEYQ